MKTELFELEKLLAPFLRPDFNLSKSDKDFGKSVKKASMPISRNRSNSTPKSWPSSQFRKIGSFRKVKACRARPRSLIWKFSAEFYVAAHFMLTCHPG